MKWMQHLEHKRQNTNACRSWIGKKPPGKRPLARPQQRWENIKTALKSLYGRV
jgi:hypothetical protein